MSKNLLYGRPEGDTVGAGAILRDILDRRDILARVFGVPALKEMKEKAKAMRPS